MVTLFSISVIALQVYTIQHMHLQQQNSYHHVVFALVGLAYQCKDIVFRLIIEYSSLMDFGP